MGEGVRRNRGREGRGNRGGGNTGEQGHKSGRGTWFQPGSDARRGSGESWNGARGLEPGAPKPQCIRREQGHPPVRTARASLTLPVHRPGVIPPNPTPRSPQQERQLLLFAEPRLSSRRMVETYGGTRCTGPLAMSAVVWPVLAMAVTSAPFSTR